MRTPVEILVDEIGTAIIATQELTDNGLTMADIIAALETTKLQWFLSNSVEEELV